MFKIYNRNRFKLFILIAGAIFTTSSCKKALDILPQDKLDKTQVYNTLADADAAVIGIYGQFARLGEKYILFNELRADLMDVTANATPYLQQLSEHNETLDNPYIDPTDFYKVILNCNDAIKNFRIMVKNSKISQSQFDQRYSDIVALRSFIYLQLGIHYGHIPYITEPLENVDDLKASNDFPKMDLDVLIDTLLNTTTTLPYLEHYAYPTNSSMNFSVDGISTRKVFINKPELIGELYLWKGEYYKAATWFKKNLSAEDNNTDVSHQVNDNRIGWEMGVVSFTKSQTASSLVNSTTSGWRSIFAQPNTSRIWNAEWTWGIPYNNSFAPGNPFVELTGSTTLGGKYMIKPSQKIIDLWKSQTLTNGVPFDARGKLSYSTTSDSDPNPVITKLTDDVSILNILNKGGNWNIYRAASTHLKFAEAANRDGQGKLAYALLNNGLLNTFYDGTYSGTDGSGTSKIPANEAESNTAITPYSQDSPYYFDARDFTIRGINWYRNQGIRGRAMMPRLELTGIVYRDTYKKRILSFNVDQTLLEDKLIEEAAMELAFEGSRWSDLMRIARRRNDPSFLANKIAEKFEKAGNFAEAEELRTKLSDPNNWYLPFKLK